MNEIITSANKNIDELALYFKKNDIMPIFPQFSLLFLDFLYLNNNKEL